jgi:MFS family permease
MRGAGRGAGPNDPARGRDPACDHPGVTEESRTARILTNLAALASAAAESASERLTVTLGGAERTRVIVVLACILGLSGADASTVGASATELRSGLHITNTDIGLLVAITSIVGAVATLPFGVLADRVRRTWTLGATIVLWGAAMLWSATASDFHELLWTRLALGAVTAAAGPMVASLVGDYFGSWERGRIYGFILAGELLGAGFGFAVTGDIAALSWRAAFVILALPAFVLAWAVFRLPEPERGGKGVLAHASEPPPGEVEDGAPHETDAQRLARERGIEPDPDLVLDLDPRRLHLIAATRYVLRIRTNVVLIAASACGYYFLAGVQTFGSEFAKDQYGINQALANLLLLLVGAGAVGGVLVGGATGDALLRRRHLNARITTAALAATATTIFFIPALFTRSAVTAVPYLTAAAFMLSAQNPPLDAARLDIMPPLLWGRAEAVRTLLRSLAQALAPLLFGAVSDHVFGGGRTGLQWTFVVMLVPLGASAVLLFRALRHFPTDVASAAASVPPRRRNDAEAAWIEA